MTAPAEQDPGKRIVDIDTFASWMVDYRRTMFEQYSMSIAGSIHHYEVGADGKTIHWDEIPRPTMWGKDTAYVVNLSLDVLWQDVPQSLREIMITQYNAALLDEEKTVHVDIGHDHIAFALHSPSVNFDIDMSSETLIHPTGVRLQFSDVEDAPTPKGSWFISKKPITEQHIASKTELAEAEWEMDQLFRVKLEPPGELLYSLTKAAWELHEERQYDNADWEQIVIPTTLTQLHDIARLFSEKWTEIKVIAADL